LMKWNASAKPKAATRVRRCSSRNGTDRSRVAEPHART
jgi:hypothetical protein